MLRPGGRLKLTIDQAARGTLWHRRHLRQRPGERWLPPLASGIQSGPNERVTDSVCCVSQYTAAAKTSTLEPTARALGALGEVFKKDAKLPVILAAPSLTAKDKAQIVAELARHTGGAADKTDMVKNFLATLADNNRLAVLPGVCDKFGALMSAYRGEVELAVTSASVCIFSIDIRDSRFLVSPLAVGLLEFLWWSQPLDNKTLSRLETAVSKSEYVGQGKKLKVTNKVSLFSSSLMP